MNVRKHARRELLRAARNYARAFQRSERDRRDGVEALFSDVYAEQEHAAMKLRIAACWYDEQRPPARPPSARRD